jgi:hypothetical protein
MRELQNCRLLALALGVLAAAALMVAHAQTLPCSTISGVLAAAKGYPLTYPTPFIEGASDAGHLRLLPSTVTTFVTSTHAYALRLVTTMPGGKPSRICDRR